MSKKKAKEIAVEAEGNADESQPEVLGDERAAMYADYEKSQETPVIDEEAIADISPEEEATGKEESEGVTGDEELKEEDAEAATEKADGDEELTDDKPEKEDKEDDEKTVPHGAFHEEREKRKKFQKKVETQGTEITELQGQVAELIKDNTAFMEQGKKAEADQTDLEALVEEGDFDEVLKTSLKRNRELEARLARLEDQDTKRMKHDHAEAVDRESERYNSTVSTLNSDLEAEGFPGFDMFVDKMNDELNLMIEDDPDNVSLNNNEGYKKIYKERVFPKVSKMFTGQHKETTFDKKRELKKKANLGNGGSKPSTPKKESDAGKSSKQLYDEYIAERNKRSNN